MFRRIVICFVVLAVVVPMLPAVTQAQGGDTITIGTTDLPRSLDPGDAYDFAAWEVLSHLYTGLTRQVPGTLDYELALAQDVSVSDDKLTYTFTLRDDAAFNDGTPITAQTFVDSINRVLTLRRDAAQAITPYVERVTADEDGALVFQLKYPVPYFLKLVSLPPYFPQYPALAQSSVPEPFAEHLIGNGPYVLDQFAVNDQIRLTANPAYDPQPATPTIVLRNFTRSQDLREALRNHEIDLVWRALVLEDLTDLEADTNFQVVEQPSTRMFYIYMNHHLEPFDDPLARQAVTLLLDRDEVAQGAFDDHVTAMTSLIPPQFEAAYDPIWPEEPDQITAETALSNAGYSSRGQVRRLGFNIYFSLSAYGTLYENAANTLNRGSFQVTRFINSGIFDRVDTSTFIQVLERGEQENVVVLFGWTPIVPDPMAYLHPLAHSSEQIPSNGRYSSSEIDDLLDQAALLDDPVAQGDLYQQVQTLLLENYDIAPLWQDHVQVIAWNDIDGIVLEPNSFLHYDQLVRR